MSEIVERLKPEFQDEDYRYAYDEDFANSRMATQIKVLREQQGLKQIELAELAEMKQSRISTLEDVNYNSWSVSTLRRLARALGVRFAFGFESWGELLPEIEGFGRKALEKPRFEKDPAFRDVTSPAQDVPVPARETARETSGHQLRVVQTPAMVGLRQSSVPTESPLLAVGDDVTSVFRLQRKKADSPSSATGAQLIKIRA